MPAVVLATINARHFHVSVGGRYLRANPGDLCARSASVEFVDVEWIPIKRLRRAPVVRHTETFGLRFDPDPPYNLLASCLANGCTAGSAPKRVPAWPMRRSG